MALLRRVLLVAVFILSAYQDFSEFGLTSKALESNFNAFSKHVATHTGFQLPHVELKHLVFLAIVMKGLGSFLIIFDSSLIGAYILMLHLAIASPILYDF